MSFTHCGNKSILRVLRIILVILPEHPSETIVFHNEDGNPARANIKQALGYRKDGDGDGNSQPHKGVKASANSDVKYSFTSAQDGEPLQDDVRLCLGNDLKKAQDHNIPQKSLPIKHVRTISPSPPLVRESTFSFKPGTKDNQNVKSQHDAENPNPQSTPQVLPSFEEYTPAVTYSNKVEEIIEILIGVEPLDETPLEDLGLNTCNHDIPLSSREIPNFDEPEPQPQPIPSCPSLDISLREERGPEPPIKPHSPDSFKMKVVDNLTIYKPSSPHMASFYPKNVYCFYHPCVEDPKKHYGFKPGLLGHSGPLCVDF
ncbi:hypothetical protein Tco_0163200 [Tanacetum coccineum]